MIKYTLMPWIVGCTFLPAPHVQPPGFGRPAPARVEAENRILVRRLRELRPTWGIPARPDVPGEYNYRYRHPDGTWQVGRMVVTARMIREGFVDDGTQWSGPIPVPAEPEEGGGR